MLREYLARILGYARTDTVERAAYIVERGLPFVLVGEREGKGLERIACVLHERSGVIGELVCARVHDGIDVATTNGRIIVCARSHACRGVCAIVDVPPLTARVTELDLIIAAYGDDAARVLGVPFVAADHAWVRAYATLSHGDVERGCLRALALREHGSVAGAADRLGMSHVALGQWFHYHRRRVAAATAS